MEQVPPQPPLRQGTSGWRQIRGAHRRRTATASTWGEASALRRIPEIVWWAVLQLAKLIYMHLLIIVVD